MSLEVTRLIAVPLTAGVAELLGDIDSAAARAAKADPADRSDIVRYEALSVQLELAALAAADRGDAAFTTVPAPAPDGVHGFLRPGDRVSPELDAGEARRHVASWLEDGHAVVCVCCPLEPGVAAPGARAEPTPAPPPAQVFRADEGLTGRRAVEDRFRKQCAGALSTDAAGRRPVISPSGIQHAIVTEILREHVEAVDGGGRVDVQVKYRDGSSATNPFPLRALTMGGRLPPADLTLRLALLSIRHTEMDVVVDGSWLRNAEVSRPRRGGQTDDIVFEISRAQLAELTQSGTRRLRLYLYQTGLEAAIVGFYRAVTQHMLKHPRTLSVVPMYHQAPPRPGKNRRKPSKDTVVQTRAPFREGAPWIA
jgi:hypothetical protein